MLRDIWTGLQRGVLRTVQDYKTIGGWIWWVVVQVIMGNAMILGWVLLIPFCLAHAWRQNGAASYADGKRAIDVWAWSWLNPVYGNPEDGVSGQQALIWINGVLSSYMPTPMWLNRKPAGSVRGFLSIAGRWLYAAWRAYCWSAWRNSCDNLKYVFAWKNGPQATIRGHKIGWWPENDFNVPVL